MVIKKEVAYGIISGLTEFWKCKELQDFTVTLGSVHYGCHRLILAACSEFFRGLFRSGMQETEQKRVTIQNISSETFELIMESIYTGHAILTDDNVLDIWQAAHQLQIHFLVSECEKYVLETLSIENYAEYFYVSNTLNSDVVLKTLRPYVLKNCNSFFQTSYFLRLPMTDVLGLIKCHDIETKSEDDVIHAILKWVEFQENSIQPQSSDVTGDCIAGLKKINQSEENEVGEDKPCRKKCKTSQDISTVGSNRNVLTDERNNQGDITNKDISCKNLTILLSHARTCLASQMCLEMLVKHPLVTDNKEARDIVIEALLYKLQVGKRNGHWPSRAIHRNASDFIHCLVSTGKRKKLHLLSAYSLARKEWSFVEVLPSVLSKKLAAVDNDLYALCTIANNSRLVVDRSTSSPPKQLSLFQFNNDHWSSRVKVFLTKSDNFHVVVVDSFLYIFLEDDKTVWRFDPATQQVTQMSSLSVNKAIAYLMPYDEAILVFSALTIEGMNKTAVHCYDTSENTWNRLNNLEGPAKGMASFKDDHSTYLLQSNGALWKVIKPPSKVINIEFVVKLWNPDWALLGAVTFLEDLHIFGVKLKSLQNDPQFMRSLPNVFREIIYHEIRGFNSTICTPILVQKKDFEEFVVPSSSVNEFHKHL